MQKNNIISDWLNKNGNKEIDEKVKYESNIKEFCRYHKLKFIKYYKDGFIASLKINIKAGIEIDLITGKCINPKIRTIGKKEITRHYLCFEDFDIVDNGIYKAI